MKYVEKFDMFQTGDDIYIRDAEAHSEIDNINQNITTIERKIDNDENELSVLNERKNKKVIILMDSYGDFYSDTLLTDLGWKKFWRAGAGFDINNSGNFNLWGIESIMSMGAETIKTFDRIVILGGFNDRNSSYENIKLGISEFYSKLKTQLHTIGIDIRNFKINIGHIGWSGTLESKERDKMFAVSIPAYKSCGEYNIGYIKNSEFTLRPYNLFGADNVHPNREEGGKRIHTCLVNYVYSGNWIGDIGYHTINMKGVGVTNAYNVGWMIDGNMCEMFLPYDTLNFESPILLSSDTPTMLLQVQYDKKTPFMGMFDNGINVQHCIQLSGYFVVSSGGTSSFISMEGMKFFIQGGFLYCLANGLNKDKTGFDTAYVSAMQIRSGAINVPLMYV